MGRKVVDTLIVDLDNTLFDWFAVWYASFNPLYEAILLRTERPPVEINDSIRRVHQQRRTSEYTFLLEEMDALKAIRESGDVRESFAKAIEQSRAGRDQTLKLYATVFRSLWEIKKQGTKIVAYTESMSFYSAYRLKRFGLDGVIDTLFSPQDHDVPAGVSVEKMRRLPDEFYELQVSETRHTPPGELKPNTRVLLDIIKAVGAVPERCAYVGDSLFKDVAMARDVGVFDIHAQYGESQRRPEYSLLQKVSHWTDADVERERAITAKGHNFVPSAVLKDAFAEIFIYCDFEKFSAPVAEKDREQEYKNVIDIWKKCVDVHQHFNDLEMRIRNLALTVVGALIAAVSFTYQQGLELTVGSIHLPAGVGLVAAAIFAWIGFFFMDRFWYHILLKGAVDHSAAIERDYGEKIPGLALGSTISKVSQSIRIFGWKVNSNRRLELFYFIGLVMLAVVFFVLLQATPHRPLAPPQPSNTVAAPITAPSAASPPLSLPPATFAPGKPANPG